MSPEHATAASERKRLPPRKKGGQGRGPRRLDGLVMDVESASHLLGATPKHVRGLVARRLCPFRRLGGRIVFVRTELEAWVRGLDGCSPAEAQANAEARR